MKPFIVSTGYAQCHFDMVKVTDSYVFIEDRTNERGGMSVTNAAEKVVAAVYTNYPGRRIFYRDSSGDWDELGHDNGKFTNFIFGSLPPCFNLKIDQ